jgi:AcrR family transcriptional regulator
MGRLRRGERRDQIIGVALDSIAQNGVRGTSLSRIAEGVGLTTPALYAHFASRREILLAALDRLFEERTLPHRFPAESNALEHLRGIAQRHRLLMAPESTQSMFALFEFIVASPEEGLRSAVGEKHLILVNELADIVRAGQSEGSIRPDADAVQVAWMIVSRAWTEDIALLMGLHEEWDEVRSNRMLDFILDSVAAEAEPGRSRAEGPLSLVESGPSASPSPGVPG